MGNNNADHNFASVHELFERQVERTPDRIALVYKDHQFTYQALNQQSNRLAYRLKQIGVRPETIVGIYVGHPTNSVIGILGVLKAGGVYTPLNINDPRNRIIAHLRHAKVQHVILDSHSSTNCDWTGSHTINLDQDIQQTDQVPQEGVNVGIHPKNLAYVIHTSGTSGEPKGVAMAHDAFANLISWHTKTLNGDNVKTLLFTSFSFDASNQELFSTICVGGTLYLIDDTIRHDPFQLISFIQENTIGRMLLFFAPLQNFMAIANDQELVFDHLRDIITAGEPIKMTSQVINFFQRNDTCRFINMYGLTETHTVTCFIFPSNPHSWSTHASIGLPISQTKISLMDEQLERLGAKECGEIYVSGLSLARGYLHRPDLTAEKYIPFPYGDVPGERACRTGDLGKTLPDGSLECLGRCDHQVKIRGYRVELSEIEAALTRHASVREAVVISQTDEPLKKINSSVSGEDSDNSRPIISHLVAYLVINPHQVVTIQTLRAYLNEHLPHYMIPSFFVFMKKIPLSRNGKVDRQLLPIPNLQDEAVESVCDAPRNPVEEVMLGLWKNVLNHENVGIHSNFFEWGGDSLAATRLISEFRKLFQYELGVRSLFEYPTVAEFSQKLGKLTAGHQNIHATARLILMVAELSEEEVDEKFLHLKQMPYSGS
ncbi:MAG: non-ribosomal peptide synthetase [Nitrospirales bacterium]